MDATLLLLMAMTLGAVAVGLCVFLFWRYPLATAVAIGAVSSCWDLLVSGGTDAAALKLGVTLYPLDIGCAALGACWVAMLLRNRSRRGDVCWPAVLLLCLCFINFVRGGIAFGFKPAGNSARGIAYLVFPAVAVGLLSSAVRMTAEKLVTCLTLAALAFGAVAGARWSGLLPVPEAMIETNGDFRHVVRVLPAAYSFIIAQALIGVMGLQLLKGFRSTGLVLAAIFASLVFALQHRSVWVATIAGLVWLVIRSPRAVRSEWLKFSTVMLFLASAVAFSSLVASSTLERGINLVRANIEEVGKDDSTWAWRVSGYTEATRRLFSSNLTDTTIGPASGADLSDRASDASIEIHDNYIYVLAYYGIAGLAFMLLWLLLTAIRLRSYSHSAPPPDRTVARPTAILEGLFVSVIIYFVPYGGDALQGLVLGALWLASATHSGVVNSVPASPRQYRDSIRPVHESAACHGVLRGNAEAY